MSNLPDEILDLDGYDDSYHLLFFALFRDFEEFGWCAIFEKNCNYFKLQHGYCVMSENNIDSINWSNLEPISEREAYEEMMEWDEYKEYPNS